MEFDVSIIIPAFNLKNYIGQALESVIREIPPFKQIIIVDDGSTDGTGEVVATFDDPRIVYRYQENQGLGPARNAGISLANSRFLYFMDGDDLLKEGMTREVHEKLYRSNAVLDAVFFSAIDFNDDSGEILASSAYFKWNREGYFPSGRLALMSSVSRASVPACVFLCVFRRDLIEEPQYLRFRNMLHEDEIFTPSLMLQCAGPVVISNTVLYRRRVRRGSIMTNGASSRNVSGSLAVAAWWQRQAAISNEVEARVFQRQAVRFYGMAIVYAARAGLRMTELSKLVAESTPGYLRWLSLDRGMASISRKFAFWFIRVRFAFFARQQDNRQSKRAWKNVD